MDEAQLKSLKVKTGTLRRLRKELGMYVEEQTKESEKVEKLRSQGADPHDIKYAVCGDVMMGLRGQHLGSHDQRYLFMSCLMQENILAESSAMVPDTRQRLEQAYDQLETFVVRRLLRLWFAIG